MVYADLHVHTTTSDGSLTLEDLPTAAKNAGVAAVAVTDHDRLNPGLDTPVQTRDDIAIITGIELRVDPHDHHERLDLLGYGVDPTPELIDEIDRLQTDRMERGAAMRDHLEAYLDIELEIPIQPGIGRPHLAHAVTDHPDTAYTDTDHVFQDLIGEDGPCFVARDVTSFERGVTLLGDACPIVGLAHPFRYDDPETALEYTTSLDAVERYYPYDRPVDTDLIADVVDTNDLLVTGGSDAHDTELGRAGLAEAEYADFRRRLPGP